MSKIFEVGAVIWRRLGDLSTLSWLWGLWLLFLASFVTQKNVADAVDWHTRFVVCSWFFGVLAAGLTTGKAVEWGYHKWRPPTVTLTPHGGSKASIAVCPSVDGQYYGSGALVGVERRQRPFYLEWVGGGNRVKSIRAGDNLSIAIAGLTADGIQIYGDGGQLLEWVLDKKELHRYGGLRESTPWTHVQIELRAKQFPNKWPYEYRFRLRKDLLFEIEEITQSTSDTAVLGLGPSA